MATVTKVTVTKATVTKATVTKAILALYSCFSQRTAPTSSWLTPPPNSTPTHILLTA